MTKLNWQPHDYQRRALDFLYKHRHGGLFLDPGLGKTSVVLTALAKWKRVVKRPINVLVVAPLRVIYQVWPDELEKWAGFDYLTISNLHTLKPAERVKEHADLLLINPELLVSYLNEKKDYQFDVLIVDESSTFKSHSSKRFKALKRHLHQFKRRYCLTGTPCPNSLQDLWSQMFIIDQGERLGKNITQFRKQYMTREILHFGERRIPKYEFLPEAKTIIENKVSQVSISMRAEEYLKLPKCIEQTINVEMSPDTRKVYARMKRQMSSKLPETGEITIFSAAELTNSLRQITSGFLYNINEKERKRETEFIHTSKIEALRELTDSLGESPVLVVLQYLGELELIRKEYGKSVPYLGGNLKSDVAKQMVNMWNRKQLPILCCHPKAMGHGLNMQWGGDHIIWFALTWSLEHYLQTNARVFRQGRERPTMIYKFVMSNSIDVAMSVRLQQKLSTQQSVRKSIERYLEQSIF